LKPESEVKPEKINIDLTRRGARDAETLWWIHLLDSNYFEAGTRKNNIYCLPAADFMIQEAVWKEWVN